MFLSIIHNAVIADTFPLETLNYGIWQCGVFNVSHHHGTSQQEEDLLLLRRRCRQLLLRPGTSHEATSDPDDAQFATQLRLVYLFYLHTILLLSRLHRYQFDPRILGLYRKMEIYRPHKATMEEMTKYHSDDYIRFLRSIRPDNMSDYNKQVGPKRFSRLNAGRFWLRSIGLSPSQPP